MFPIFNHDEPFWYVVPNSIYVEISFDIFGIQFSFQFDIRDFDGAA